MNEPKPKDYLIPKRDAGGHYRELALPSEAAIDTVSELSSDSKVDIALQLQAAYAIDFAALRTELAASQREVELFKSAAPSTGSTDEAFQELYNEKVRLQREVQRLTICECGRKLGNGYCSVCDNDK